MRFRAKRLAVGGAVAALALVGLAACSNVKTDASQCAYVIQNGYFDAAHVKKILLPGERYNGNNVKDEEVPCNARNYAVTNSNANTGDLKTPIGAKTAAGTDGTPGTPVNVQLTAYFALNENHDALQSFLSICQKYDCFTGKYATDSTSHFSSPGWNGLLAENFQFALTRAVQHAVLQFPPDVWNDTSKWPDVGDAVSADLDTQLRQNLAGNYDYFCASGATAGQCPPIRVTVEHIDPADPQIVSLYNQQVAVSQQEALSKAQEAANVAALNAAKAKYGVAAGEILGELDVIGACKSAGTTCVINLGGGSTSISVPK